MGIVLAIVVLSLLIIIHELGHFLVAKAFKVKVNEFSLFMGPKLWSFQMGETTYSLRLIPLGGYVKMEGEEEASDDARAFNKKPIGVRSAIIAAGPIMNILLAILVIFFIMLPMGYTTNTVKSVAPGSSAEAVGIKAGDRFEKYNGSTLFQMNDMEVLSYPMSVNDKVKLQINRNGESQTIEFTPNRNGGYILGFSPMESAIDGPDSNVVGNVSDKSAAMDAGLRKGDRIVGLNDKPVSSRQDIKNILNEVKGNKVKITVLRDGNKLDLKEVTPTVSKLPETYAIGVSFESAKGNIASTFVQSIKYNISMSRTIILSVGWLFQRVVPVSDMMGPVGITSTIKDVVEQSPSFVDKLVNLLSFASMISINLGLLNLFPFPALDGSKLVLLAIEGIRKKPLAPEKEAFITMVGFVLLIMLMIYVTFNDVLRLGRG